jgi:hypothetical protein
LSETGWERDERRRRRRSGRDKRERHMRVRWKTEKKKKRKKTPKRIFASSPRVISKSGKEETRPTETLGKEEIVTEVVQRREC